MKTDKFQYLLIYKFKNPNYFYHLYFRNADTLLKFLKRKNEILYDIYVLDLYSKYDVTKIFKYCLTTSYN